MSAMLACCICWKSLRAGEQYACINGEVYCIEHFYEYMDMLHRYDDELDDMLRRAGFNAETETFWLVA